MIDDKKENENILRFYVEKQFYQLVFDCLQKKAMLEQSTTFFRDIDKTKTNTLIDEIICLINKKA